MGLRNAPAEPPPNIERTYNYPHALLGTDGACTGNPDGNMASGVHLMTRPDGEVLCSNGHRYDFKGTNNESEFLAMIYGLAIAKNHGIRHLRAVSDSQLMINALTGKYKLNAKNLIPLRDQIKELEGEFESVEYYHRSREHWLPKICDANAATALQGFSLTPDTNEELLEVGEYERVA